MRLISVKVCTVSFLGTGLFCFSVAHFGFKRSVEIKFAYLALSTGNAHVPPRVSWEEGGLCISDEDAAHDSADKSLALNWTKSGVKW